MRLSAILLLCSLFFISCEETIQLDLEQTGSEIIIEGLVTNKPGRQYVKISRSNDFYDSERPPRVTNATVTVTDDLGNVHGFVHNPRQVSDSAGYYFPQTTFYGEIGRAYTLRVTADGKVYTAQDELSRVMPIDSLSYRENEDQLEDPETPGKTYEVLLFVTEPREETNYYLFKFYANDSLAAGETDVFVTNDEFLAENIDGVPAPGFYAQNDTVKVEVYSLSRTAYVFYFDLFNLINNDGGIFGPPQANARTNLSGGALGFFRVSAVSEGEIVVK